MTSNALSIRFATRTYWNQPLAVGVALLIATLWVPTYVSAQSFDSPSSAVEYGNSAAATDEYSTSAIELEVARLEATNQAMLKSVSEAKQASAPNDSSADDSNKIATSKVGQVAYQTGYNEATGFSSTESDPMVSTEFAELKAQVESQRFEMASLQSQIKLRDVELKHAAPRLFMTYENLLLQPLQSNSSGLIVETPTALPLSTFLGEWNTALGSNLVAPSWAMILAGEFVTGNSIITNRSRPTMPTA